MPTEPTPNPTEPNEPTQPALIQDALADTNPNPEDTAQLRAQLAQAEARLAETRRRYELENALREAGAIDVEAAAILIERAREEAGDTANTGREAGATDDVRQLEAQRPYLFRKPAPPTQSAGSALSPAVNAPSTDLRRAAEQARNGDPNAVLRYMRLRREVN